jgi:alkaline phosphatase D
MIWKVIFLGSLALAGIATQAQTSHRIAFGSCADYVGEKGDSILTTIATKTKPDLFLWLGDNVYYEKADYASPKGMKEAVQNRFSNPRVKSFLQDLPQRAIWDDHDYGPNDSDSSFVYRKESQEIFSKFWKETPTKLNKYGDLRWLERRGNLLIVGLDNRSHRGPVGTQMLGNGQLLWLESVLLEHQDATVVLVAVGSQVLNEAHVFENYVRFPERKRFLDLLDRAPQKRVVLLTGDRHHSETNRLLLPSGKMLVEYTSSALSSKLFAPTPKEVEANIHLDPTSVVTDYNYGLLELDGSGNLRAAYLDRMGQVLWEELLTP